MFLHLINGLNVKYLVLIFFNLININKIHMFEISLLFLKFFRILIQTTDFKNASNTLLYMYIYIKLNNIARIPLLLLMRGNRFLLRKVIL